MLLMPSSREALIDAINMNGDGAISLLGESLRVPYSVYHREKYDIRIYDIWKYEVLHTVS